MNSISFNYPFRNEGEIKTYTDEQRECVARRTALDTIGNSLV